MIDTVRLGHADSPHGLWIASWVKEQMLQTAPHSEITLVATVPSLVDFEDSDAIPDSLAMSDMLVVDGSFLPQMDPIDVVVAAVCERADPRHCIVGHGTSLSVWHPSMAAVLKVTDPATDVTVDFSLIDGYESSVTSHPANVMSVMLPSHVAGRIYGQRMGQVSVEAEDLLSVGCQASTLVYTKQSDKELGSALFDVLNVVDTRRELTVERFFKAQLDLCFHKQICCYAAGSDRFLYLFVTMVINNTIYKTRSGAHISALTSIVDQALDDLERQSGRIIRHQID